MPGGPGQGGDPSLVRLLAGWLPRQRWFGGKDSPIEDLSIGTATELRTGEPGLHHLVLDVRQSGATEHYQVLLGVRRDLPERLRSHEIGLLTGATGITGHAYDAAHDPELTRPLLAHMARESVIGPLHFRRAPGTGIRTDLDGTPSTAEQSNTSLIFGDAYMCKLFRKLAPGMNPDLEVNLALTRAVSDAVEVPVIASGGVGNAQDLVDGVVKGHASAVLAASIFHFGEVSIAQAKDALKAAGLPIRPI